MNHFKVYSIFELKTEHGILKCLNERGVQLVNFFLGGGVQRLNIYTIILKEFHVQ